MKTAFLAKFPNVQNAKWDLENGNEWEAEFKMNGKEMSTNFKNDGTWLETETEIKTTDLPVAVKNAVTANFAGYKMEEASMVEMADHSGYEVELEKGEKTIEALFSADGTLIQQMAEEEDGEDGDKD